MLSGAARLSVQLARRLCRPSLLPPAQSLTITTRLTMSTVKAQFVFPDDLQLVKLDASTAFQQLSISEQLYSHHLSQASWWGGLIVLLQAQPSKINIRILFPPFV